MRGLNPILFLFFLDLFQNLRQSLLLNLVGVALIFYLFVLVHLLDVLFMNFVFFILVDFAHLVDFKLFAVQS
jgi:hypothetical protein